VDCDAGITDRVINEVLETPLTFRALTVYIVVAVVVELDEPVGIIAFVSVVTLPVRDTKDAVAALLIPQVKVDVSFVVTFIVRQAEFVGIPCIYAGIEDDSVTYGTYAFHMEVTKGDDTPGSPAPRVVPFTITSCQYRL